MKAASFDAAKHERDRDPELGVLAAMKAASFDAAKSDHLKLGRPRGERAAMKAASFDAAKMKIDRIEAAVAIAPQ